MGDRPNITPSLERTMKLHNKTSKLLSMILELLTTDAQVSQSWSASYRGIRLICGNRVEKLQVKLY
eukprot:1691753-Amphidinium_carterae.1